MLGETILYSWVVIKRNMCFDNFLWSRYMLEIYECLKSREQCKFQENSRDFNSTGSPSLTNSKRKNSYQFQKLNNQTSISKTWKTSEIRQKMLRNLLILSLLNWRQTNFKINFLHLMEWLARQIWNFHHKCWSN